MTTASNLVFQTAGTNLYVYRADTGEDLLALPFNIGGPAPPVTYTVDGTQYIGFATRTHFMALKIGGTEKFPEAPPTPGRGAPKGPPPAPPAAAPKPEAELHGNDKQ